jgi:hypothetical protein
VEKPISITNQTAKAMKKTVLTATAAVAMALAGATGAGAQDRAQLPETESSHSVSVNLIGVDYAYELPLGRTATIIGRAGANFGASWYGKNGGSWRTGVLVPYGDNYRTLSPAVELEPRWYYGLDRRAALGRDTGGNAGSFVSLKAQSLLHELGGDSRDYGIAKRPGLTTFAPTWGVRRVWRGHWNAEFTAGVRFGVAHDGEWWDEGSLERLDINLRFGYTF